GPAPSRRNSPGHARRRPACRRTRAGHRPAAARSAARRARTARDAPRRPARARMRSSARRFLRPRDYYDLTRNSIRAWHEDYAASLGAAIAFYTAFSVAPLMIILIAVAGFVWGEEAVRGELIRQLGDLVGSDAAAGIQALIRGADQPSQGVTATLISVGVLIWGATRVFAELQTALDRIWEVPRTERAQGIWGTLRARLLSFGLVLGLAFLLLVSLVVTTGLAALGQWAGSFFPGMETLLQLANTLVTFAIITVLFAMIFKFMPQATIAWRDVWIGALVTAVLFEIGKLLIGMYVGKSASVSVLAAAGSLIILLIDRKSVV